MHKSHNHFSHIRANILLYSISTSILLALLTTILYGFGELPPLLTLLTSSSYISYLLFIFTSGLIIVFLISIIKVIFDSKSFSIRRLFLSSKRNIVAIILIVVPLALLFALPIVVLHPADALFRAAERSSNFSIPAPADTLDHQGSSIGLTGPHAGSSSLPTINNWKPLLIQKVPFCVGTEGTSWKTVLTEKSLSCNGTGLHLAPASSPAYSAVTLDQVRGSIYNYQLPMRTQVQVTFSPADSSVTYAGLLVQTMSNAEGLTGYALTVSSIGNTTLYFIDGNNNLYPAKVLSSTTLSYSVTLSIIIEKTKLYGFVNDQLVVSQPISGTSLNNISLITTTLSSNTPKNIFQTPAFLNFELDQTKG